MSEEQLQIVKMVELGQINAQEAAALLAALDATIPEPSQEAPDAALTGDRPADAWSRFWYYPLIAGGIVLIAGALVLVFLLLAGAATGWIICGSLPLLLGAGVVLLSWWSRGARWLHLRISEPGQRKIALSIPLPLTLASWVLRIAQPLIPQLKETGVDDLIIALRDGTLQDGPIFIDVQDDENGEHVQIYIG